jgi:hypothetical protein
MKNVVSIDEVTDRCWVLAWGEMDWLQNVRFSTLVRVTKHKNLCKNTQMFFHTKAQCAFFEYGV